MKKIFFLVLLSLFFSMQNVRAVVATPNNIIVNQSDKTTLELKLQGDERLHWASTIDGYTVLENKNKDYVYAVSDAKGHLAFSDVLAHNPQERSAEEISFLSSLKKGLFFSQEQLSIINQYNAARFDFERRIQQKSSSVQENYRMLVILMSFSDFEFTTSSESIERLYNQVGYSENGNGGSIHDYFIASSNNKLNVSASVVGPYTTNGPLSYYGNDYYGEYEGFVYTQKDINVRELIQEAIYAAHNDGVNFSEFTNGNINEEVECVYVIYAGFSQAAGNSSETIWPHRSHLMEPLNINGITFYNYGCSSEFEGMANFGSSPMMIGTICHEFSHVLGLPDFYDTHYQNMINETEAFHPGGWDLMASGNYNGGGGYPPLWSATEMSFRNYVTIEEITEGGSYTLLPLDENYKAFRIKNTAAEYFILENRQQRGFDTHLPGHGMLIYHVDRTQWDLTGNCVNCNPGREGYRVVCSPNVINGSNPFPFGGKTSFTDVTTPGSKTYDGDNTNKPVYNIVENSSSKNVTFVYMDGDNYPYISNTAFDFFGDTLRFTAEISANNSSVSEKGICYSSINEVPTTNDETMVLYSNGTDISANITDLEPNTYYYVRAYAKSGNYIGYGETMKIKTPCGIIDILPYKISFEENEAFVNCLQQDPDKASNKWQIITNGDEEITHSAYDGERFAFINSDTKIGAYSMKLICGPFNTNRLSSPALSFAYDQKYIGNRRDNISVYYKTSLNSDWTLLKSYSEGTDNWTLDTVDLPQNSSTLYIAFQSACRSAGGIYLDNIEITEKNAAAYPNVLTIGISDVLDNAATAKANLISTGINPLDAKGFAVSESAEPTIYDMVYYSSGSNTGQYQTEINNLNPQTTYYLRPFAISNGVISYGAEISFTTECPRITQYPYIAQVSDCFTNQENAWTANDDNSFSYSVVSSEETGKKLITPILSLANMDNVRLKFNYKGKGTLKIYFSSGINSTWQDITSLEFNNSEYMSAEYPVSASLSLTDRSFIAFALEGEASDNVFLQNIQINTTFLLPVIVTESAYLSQYNEISVNCSVQSQGQSPITRKGVCWSLNNNPEVSDNVIVSNSSDDNFTVQISERPIMTQHYVRAFAENSFGVSYGEIIPISTAYYDVENNTISEDQRICASMPQTLHGSTPTGGNGIDYEYTWIRSLDLTEWEICDEGVFNNQINYSPRPETLNGTFYYARIVTSGHTNDTSNYVTIIIDAQTREGSIASVPQDITDIDMYDLLTLRLKAYTGSILTWQVREPNMFDTSWTSIEESENKSIIAYVPEVPGVIKFRASVQNGSCLQKYSEEYSINVRYKVGLEELKENNNEFVLSPNPSNGKIVLNSSEKQRAKISIHNTEGKLLYSRENELREGDNEFDFSFLRTGTYILTLNGKDSSWQTKLIITSK
ncbi:MAG: M6 family metalloprotease domain-containing protein [Bacteroidales bacterium]|nr:M6 family metalloprotease domain-containing protein [Bacteroidales bacterium]